MDYQLTELLVAVVEGQYRTTANVARVSRSWSICSHGVAPSSVLRFH